MTYYSYVTDSCVTNCPDYLVPDSTNRKCINCKVTGMFFYNGACVASSCPALTVIEDSSRNGCDTCAAKSQYYENGVCVLNCSAGRISDPQAICIACADNQVIKDNICVSNCGDRQYYDANRICNACPIGKVVQLNYA